MQLTILCTCLSLFDPVIYKTPYASLHYLPFWKVGLKWKHFESMWQILHASFWKYSRLFHSGISLNWSILDEVTTRNSTAYVFGPCCKYVYLIVIIMYFLLCSLVGLVKRYLYRVITVNADISNIG